MNRYLSHYGKLALCIAVCLLLTLLCAAAVAQDVYTETYLQFGDTITWDTTKDQMFALENVTDEKYIDTYEVGDLILYGIDHQMADGLTEGVYYIFKADQLVLFCCTFRSYSLPEGVELDGIYDSQLENLTTIYGEPTIDDDQRLVAMVSVLNGAERTAADIVAFTGWNLGDGAELYLAKFEDQNVTYIYAQMDMILGEE